VGGNTAALAKEMTTDGDLNPQKQIERIKIINKRLILKNLQLQNDHLSFSSPP
jgi:hypothetical protein